MDLHSLESAARLAPQMWHAKLSRLEEEGIDVATADIDDEEKRFWLALQMHPDVKGIIAQASEFPESYWRERFEREEKANPVGHVLIHAMVKGAAEEDPHFKPAFASLVSQAEAYQTDAAASRHVAEHALGLALAEYVWRADRKNPKAALRELHDVLERCAKWKRVPKRVVEIVRTPVDHYF